MLLIFLKLCKTKEKEKKRRREGGRRGELKT